MKTVKLVVVDNNTLRDHLQQVLGDDFKVIVRLQSIPDIQYELVIFVDGWNKGYQPEECKSWVFNEVCDPKYSKEGFTLIGCPYKTF